MHAPVGEGPRRGNYVRMHENLTVSSFEAVFEQDFEMCVR